MLVDLICESDIILPFDVDKLITAVVQASIQYLHCPYDIAISVTLTDDVSIQKMNQEFREIDRSTDVLSFPLIPFTQPNTFTAVDDEPLSYLNPETKELELGDIVISLEHVIAQANEYGHSQKRELGFLIAHSMLHLCGFDHINPKDAEEMERMQEDILQSIGLDRTVKD